MLREQVQFTCAETKLKGHRLAYQTKQIAEGGRDESYSLFLILNAMNQNGFAELYLLGGFIKTSISHSRLYRGLPVSWKSLTG